MGFSTDLLTLFVQSFPNDFEDNWDTYRFGPRPNIPLSQRLLKKLTPKLVSNDFSDFLSRIQQQTTLIESAEWLYQHLEDKLSRRLLLLLVAYRVLGYKKVALPLNNDDYWQKIDAVKNMRTNQPAILVQDFSEPLQRYSIDYLKKSLTLHAALMGVVNNFLLEQYRLKRNGVVIEAEPGDVVIDGGACWGDSTLAFVAKVGQKGMVFAFEFNRANVEVFQRNLQLNKTPQNISLCQQPLMDKSKTVAFRSNGPGTYLTHEGGVTDDSVQSISIDDFVASKKVQKVNFIKMDIEGSEHSALCGARKTLKKFKPKLAISAYHRPDDFRIIPELILSIVPTYRFYLDHFSIHNEETVLFAIAE